MKDLGTALTLIGAGACWYFVIAYHVATGGDWRHSPAGRHLMQLSGGLGLLMTLILAARVWPTYPGRPWVTLAVFAYVVIQMVWRCVLLHRAQRVGKRR